MSRRFLGAVAAISAALSILFTAGAAQASPSWVNGIVADQGVCSSQQTVAFGVTVQACVRSAGDQQIIGFAVFRNKGSAARSIQVVNFGMSYRELLPIPGMVQKNVGGCGTTTIPTGATRTCVSDKVKVSPHRASAIVQVAVSGELGGATSPTIWN